MKTVSSYTLGCKLNFSETSSLSESLVSDGYQIVPFGERSDVVIINTCSVTDNANKKCRNIIRRALRHSPGSFVIVTGCYAQLESSEIASIEGVDLILGAKEKFSLRETLLKSSIEKKKEPLTLVSDIESVESFGYGHSLANAQTRDRTRAYLKVQDGCDYSCSYCTIPLARGKSRSPKIDEVVEQAKKLIENGYQEIVLTGVNIGDFGVSSKGTSLYDLLCKLDTLPIKRLRISSIEPNLLSSKIIDLVAQSKRIMPHFHLPMQSGSDKMLQYMQRRYNKSLYKEKIYEATEKIKDVCIGADVIVGFLGETDELFEQTYKFIECLPLAYLHVFTFSMRPRTKAATMHHLEIPSFERKRVRRQRLEALSFLKRKIFNSKMLKQKRDVLFEEDFSNSIKSVSNQGDKVFYYGYTDNYVRVCAPIDFEHAKKQSLQGEIKQVNILELDEELNAKGSLI